MQASQAGTYRVLSVIEVSCVIYAYDTKTNGKANKHEVEYVLLLQIHHTRPTLSS